MSSSVVTCAMTDLRDRVGGVAALRYLPHATADTMSTDYKGPVRSIRSALRNRGNKQLLKFVVHRREGRLSGERMRMSEDKGPSVRSGLLEGLSQKARLDDQATFLLYRVGVAGHRNHFPDQEVCGSLTPAVPAKKNRSRLLRRRPKECRLKRR